MSHSSHMTSKQHIYLENMLNRRYRTLVDPSSVTAFQATAMITALEHGNWRQEDVLRLTIPEVQIERCPRCDGTGESNGAACEVCYGMCVIALYAWGHFRLVKIEPTDPKEQ